MAFSRFSALPAFGLIDPMASPAILGIGIGAITIVILVVVIVVVSDKGDDD